MTVYATTLTNIRYEEIIFSIDLTLVMIYTHIIFCSRSNEDLRGRNVESTVFLTKIVLTLCSAQ